ncbi:alpha/beta hydrolase [Natrinema gelatinilyticum]|uniref:alpha/beta hydrolase n=1 Tax=Natrinema gelatinilyticum TaxID=2961571 RepID=UPI0020C31AC6|nr:alpha/beta hydrolase [Natrinema gelatinilyticum]
MPRDDTLVGVDSRIVDTGRLRTHYLESGESDQDADRGQASRADDGSETVIFLHGNVSSSRFFEDVLVDLPDRHRAIAPDLRGYGDSETKPVDATNGLGDFEVDLHAFVDALGIERPFVLVGWSNGGGVAMRYAIDHPDAVAALVLVNPLSPYGFGGTKDVHGTPSFDDYAGSGGGTANWEFVSSLQHRARDGATEASPRKILRTYYVDPTHDFDEDREESYLTGMLDTATGDENYPGSTTESDNWPGTAPGETGVNNAISPKYCDLEEIIEIDSDRKPPITWIRGDSDQIVSNASLFDVATLGRMGHLPDWPGEDVFPPQPMVDQTRAVFETYADRGGEYVEVVLAETGHTPHVEAPGEFLERVVAALQ